MDPFFLYVSITALVLLIVILIIVGVSMSKISSLDPYPPIMNACPDYWDVSSNPAYCGVPVNSNMRNIGQIVSTNGSVDTTKPQNIGMCLNNASSSSFGCSKDKTLFNLAPAPSSNNFQYVQLSNNPNWGKLYPGISERCAQRSWANTMNITWDGVTNYNGC